MKMTTKIIIFCGVSIISLWFWYAIGSEFVATTSDPRESFAPMIAGLSWMVTQGGIVFIMFHRELSS